MVRKAILVILLYFLPAGVVPAGPPFRTDDPVPVGYRQGEV